MAAIGEVIDDKYEILKLIGRGGMSRVYLAMDKRLNKQWAVKEIEKRAHDKNNEVVIQSAIAEANMIKKLDHPALPRIVDIIDNGNVICIVMDYIEGEPLSKILDSEGPQPEETVIEWAKQLCEVLDYLHTRKPPIIYRDMKPANVMLKPDGTVKLIDFGIAREYKEHNLADTIVMGTKGYAAPEQYGNAGQTDARTDVYCLGVTLYHLVTGHNPAEPPYEIYPIRHWDPQLSAGLEVIIQRCVQQNPNDRYQSCAELMYALQHYEEYGEEYRISQRRKLKSFIITLASSVVCLGLALITMGLRTGVNNADYKEQMTLAEKATSTEEKIEQLQKANKIMPMEFEPYENLIAIFEDKDEEGERKFTPEEESILKSMLNVNLADLRTQNNYEELAFDIGKLYWYYYSYGDESNRQKSAVTWFEDVLQYSNESSSNYKTAEVYKSIGEFEDKIDKTQLEAGTSQGMFSDYWGDLKMLLQKTSKSDAEIVQLETYNLIMNQIYVRSKQFAGDGVEQEDMQNVYDEVVERVDELEISEADDSLSSKKKAITDKIDDTQKRIKKAYEKSVKDKFKEEGEETE